MKKGLTLIEVMVAASIFSFISLSLFLLLRTGIFVRKRIENKLTAHQSISINLERAATELRNAVFFRQAQSGFKGYEDEDTSENILEFYTLLFDYPKNRPLVSMIVYRFNKDKGVLYKTVRKPFSRSSEEKKFEYLENLQDFKLSYFDETLSPLEQWQVKDKLPKGIKIELAYKQDDNGAVAVLSKCVYIYRQSGR